MTRQCGRFMSNDTTAAPAQSAGPAASAAELAADLAAANRVLRLASGALDQLAASLGDAFSAAVSAILATEGRVIVSGMGKSGHVARKIAATLASTGTPAHFVHPGEASHGDLGMITRGDCVLMLSNSGENQELGDLIAHAKRIAAPLIAITSRADSTLAKAGTVTLLLPHAEEACPIGMAPTTSSTMMMSLGDALAVALMERRGFTKDKYRELHPGGRLGQMLIRVMDVLPKDRGIPMVTRDTPVSEAVSVITRHGLGCTGVADAAGRLIGVITDGDLRRHMGPDLVTRAAGDIMTANPRTIEADAFAAEALARMNEVAPPITCLFVVPAGSAAPPVPTGIVHLHDILRAGLS